jgi:hypothetical protein
MEGFLRKITMLTHITLSVILFLSLLVPGMSFAARFGESLCDEPGYSCMTVEPGESWESLFPFFDHRDLVKRVNRMNLRLRPGMVLAVPDDLDFVDLMDISPLERYIEPGYTRKIIVDLDELAWGAYDPDGALIMWGPVSGGQDYCKDVKRPCNTQPGVFTVYRKSGSRCISKSYPVGKGGAKMPYCMFYSGGYAIHGSYSVPGYHASHGCVRTFIDDAKWLNNEFTKLGETRVIVQ